VTITKSISIRSDGAVAGVLVSGTNGIVVNAGPADTVVLHGLDLEGLGTGLDGVKFLAGGALHVESCAINGFTQAGIEFAPTAASRLFVKDTVVRNNNPSGGSSFGGVFIDPGLGGSVTASLDNVRIEQNFHGLRVQGNAKVTATRTLVAGNVGSGFFVTSPSNTELNLDHCTSSANGTGVRSGGGTATVRMSTCEVTDNTVGLAPVSGGTIASFGNNRIAGNMTDGAPNTTLSEQ
jgi:hypothetical protein